jgi:malonyl-CoA/methylmalonyl-CoA synthetase
VAAKPGTSLSEDTIAAVAAGKLANYKRPKRIVLATDLPVNAMGKVLKNVLRDRYRAIFE